MYGRPWNQKDIDWLKENWELPDSVLCDNLNRSIGTVRTKRRELGLIGKPNQRKSDWSPDDIDAMREMWGSKTIPQIAKKLGRSETAINIKAKRLGLGTFKDSSEYLPALQISKLLGVDIHAITDYWIPKCGLKFKRISPRGKQYFTYIKITDVMEWLWLNPDKWDSRRVELYAFGCEPEWLQAKRKLDLASKPRGCFKWTAQEDAKLVMLYRSGAKIQDIADTLGRTHAGVEHRAARLDIWGNGAYIGNKRQQKRKEKAEAFERVALQTRLISVLKARLNELNFDGYWQKEMCMNWHLIKGCVAGCPNCDDCAAFIRIRPQYCVRCGSTFIEREENLRCPRCREQRRRQALRKHTALQGRRVSALS